MQIAPRSVPILLVLGLAACGCSSDPDPEPIASNPNQLTLTTPEFEVPPGDSFECFYTDVKTTKELGVHRAVTHQGTGGHHMTVFYVDNEHPVGHHPCVDAEMVSWNFIAGGDELGKITAELPDGLAFKIPEGKQIVIQSHLVNTTGASLKLSDTITIESLEPAEIEAYANHVFVEDHSFEIAPNSSLTFTSTCTMPAEVKAILVNGHMHEYGKYYKLEMLSPDEKSATTLYEVDWTPEYFSHPPLTRFPVDAPLVLPKGARLRQTCTWDNTTGDPLLFPREMCVGYFDYYPDNGLIDCENDPL